MKKLGTWLLIGLFLLISAGFCLFTNIRQYSLMPEGVNDEEKGITIRPGQGFRAITQKLLDNGMIVAPLRFSLYARMTGYDKKIRAGEYRLNPGLSPREILQTLSEGKVVLYRLTIPEGFTLKQIAAVVQNSGLATASDFIKTASDPGLLKRLSIPAKTLEGYLFPETYYFPKSVDAEGIILVMARRFRSVFNDTWKARAGEMGFTVHEIVTLAAIIEKETGAADERPLIASVFHNRLKKRMRLESDPTVIYGIEGFDGNITRRHLQEETPYNTYRIRGLPPGPIASPGRAALYAALYPAETDYLFFVARKNRTHVFSRTVAEHNRAVRKHQLRRR